MSFDPRELRKKKACVLGLGLSGLACARLLVRKGFKVFGSDSRPRAELAKALPRMPAGFAWEGGGHSARVLKCGFAVKSPGLLPSLPILARLREAGIPVFSELEVALAFCKAKEIIAITGTNGKTTTTALTGEIFQRATRRLRRRAYICGNIGLPLSEAAHKAGEKDILILEVSSYQLEDSTSLRPRAAALLNITADHLDHHGGMSRYIEAKARIFRKQGESDLCVFNASDPIVLKLSRRCRARRLYFAREPLGPVQAWPRKGRIRVKLPGSREIALDPPRLPGQHNLENAMAAALLALGRGISAAEVQKGFRSFQGIAHRLEEAGTFQGIRCLNDSKATNVDSTLVALRALGDFKDRILLILGGLHKGSPYTPLAPLVSSGVKGILTIGSASRKIEEDLGGLKPIFPCGDLKTAVETAFKIGSRGDVLLLSPACASFDQFKNFEERGEQFKRLVRSAR